MPWIHYVPGSEFPATRPELALTLDTRFSAFYIVTTHPNACNQHNKLFIETEVPMKKSRLSVLVLLAAVCIFGCQNSDMFSIDDAPGVTLMVHPDDPRIARIVSEDGDAFEVFGTKDADGIPTAMDTIRHQLPEEIGTDNATLLRFNGNENLSGIETKNGLSFTFTWTDNTTAIIEVLSADGVLQGMIAHDFADPDREIDLSEVSGSGSLAGPRKAAPLSLDSTTAQSKGEQVFVSVTKCGKPVDDAYVNILMTREDGKGRTLFYRASPAVDAGLGAGYAVMLPTWKPKAPLSLDALNMICSAAAPILGQGCNVVSVTPLGSEVAICAKIAAMLDIASGPSGVKAAAIAPVCIGGFESLRIYCATLGNSGVTGGQSTVDIFCDGVKKKAANLEQSGKVTLQASVFVPGEGKHFSDPVSVASTGPFGSITIKLPDDPAIKALYNTPKVPDATESYVATAKLTCLSSGMSATLSVEDTDSSQTYTSSQTADATTGDMTLNVVMPARDQIVDLISIEIDGGQSRYYPLIIYGVTPDPDPDHEPDPDPDPDPDPEDIEWVIIYWDEAQTKIKERKPYLVLNGVRTNKLHGNVEYYYENGVLTSSKPYAYGILHGVWKLWRADGMLSREVPYENGQLHGLERRWYENGTLAFKTPWMLGEEHGTVETYFDDGSLWNTGSWVNGLKQGVHTGYTNCPYYDPPCQYDPPYFLEAKKTYIDNVLQLHQHYWASGALQSEYFYENGQQLCIKTYAEDGTLTYNGCS